MKKGGGPRPSMHSTGSTPMGNFQIDLNLDDKVTPSRFQRKSTIISFTPRSGAGVVSDGQYSGRDSRRMNRRILKD